uniref:RGS domain-containing protein n=1 Tax=Petromyzon marinus TaxID=7757 RepID=S4RNQ4_PETMA
MLAACDAMLHADASSFFTEDTLRPPVPGEEGKGAKYRCAARTAAAVQQSVHKPSRSNEPEGSASPPVPCPLWGESLQTLLEDCDGASLFRAFLASDSSEDMLDFWFACAGYRRLGHADGGRRLGLARAIHRRYLAEGGDGRGSVSQLLSPGTRARVRRGVESGRAELSLLDEAQGEVHAALEAGAYVAFLKSDVLAEYARSGGNSPGP